MCRRTCASYCIAAASRRGSNRHRGDTSWLGVWGEELFSDRGRSGDARLRVVWGRIRGVRRGCSCRCVRSTGGGCVGGRDQGS